MMKKKMMKMKKRIIPNNYLTFKNYRICYGEFPVMSD